MCNNNIFLFPNRTPCNDKFCNIHVNVLLDIVIDFKYCIIIVCIFKMLFCKLNCHIYIKSIQKNNYISMFKVICKTIEKFISYAFIQHGVQNLTFKNREVHWVCDENKE